MMPEEILKAIKWVAIITAINVNLICFIKYLMLDDKERSESRFMKFFKSIKGIGK